MSTLRDGVTFAELQAKRDREVAIIEARKAVVEAAKRWYDTRCDDISIGTAVLAAKVQALREVEAQQ